ncbi:RNA-guided endonuclease TnpB family protein [Methanofollis ethanolicus]|uniref:RNA-guided endonuclease TnpB family protein n=1 Tax=Methanofollis ethanolicus TaxID=488124 RepID=UPI0008320D96|nr:RNA-guided endonuclease TnpB family protein [Methanofollis ethanolicus]
MHVIRTSTFKLQLPDGGSSALLDTMRAYSTAFSVSAQWGFENHTWNKVENHKATYKGVRESVPDLPSSLVQGARDCACEALKATRCKTIPERKPLAAMRYNQRVITVNLVHGLATIASVRGRIKATVPISGYHRNYLSWTVTSSTLSYDRRKKVFYLHISMEHLNVEPVQRVEVLGIDRGIVNVAVCSDNTFFNSRQVKCVRSKYARLRQELQSGGTRSAQRKLRRMAGRERRFVTDTNHCISKQIVNSEYTVFALEDLSKIRVQKRRGTGFNRKLNTWSFYELEQFLRYKAEALGKQVVLVDARYTSQKCSVCGHACKRNRDGSSFRCRKCGFQLHADLNAARNIAQVGISCLSRLSVNQPNVAHS